MKDTGKNNGGIFAKFVAQEFEIKPEHNGTKNIKNYLFNIDYKFLIYIFRNH